MTMDNTPKREYTIFVFRLKTEGSFVERNLPKKDGRRCLKSKILRENLPVLRQSLWAGRSIRPGNQSARVMPRQFGV